MASKNSKIEISAIFSKNMAHIIWGFKKINFQPFLPILEKIMKRRQKISILPKIKRAVLRECPSLVHFKVTFSVLQNDKSQGCCRQRSTKLFFIVTFYKNLKNFQILQNFMKNFMKNILGFVTVSRNFMYFEFY